LIAINSISLALALIANIALLLHMARRISFAIAQSFAIIGWYLSGFLLIALVAVAGSSSSGFRLDPPEQHALSQAYYYAILAAILYMIIASFMIYTVVGAYRGHYPKEFSLTTAQRTLMLQTILFMMYLLLGALVFKHTENWQFSDAVFFANFTLLTIGLGSPFSPTSHVGRSLLFPFAIGGILTVGLVIGSIRSLALERGKKKLQARFVEKKREATVDSINPHRRTIKISLFKTYHFSEDGMNESQKREQEFSIMRKIQDEATSRQQWIALAISSMAGLTLWLVGAAIFAVCERPQGWTYFTALYFSYTSLLTIGYGDVQPQSNSGKPFFVLWTLLAVPTLTILISHLGSTVVKSFADLAIWAGKVTILPGDSGVREQLKVLLHSAARGGGKFNPKDFRFEKPPGFLPYQDDNNQQTDQDANVHEHALGRLSKHVEDEELEEAMKDDSTDMESKDMQLYHYVLVRELRDILTDVHTEPTKRYSYKDWAWFLKLVRQDEGEESIHQSADEAATAKEDIERELSEAEDEEHPTWSWLGVKSPLMSAKNEPQWLADRIGGVLEQEMKRLRSKKPFRKAPISIADLRKRRGEEKEEEVKKDKQDNDEAVSQKDDDSERVPSVQK
jgi:potassium channel subfamily K